jgi:phospholipase/lecithinase/hemolysin
MTQTTSFSAIYAFGDSLSDAGNLSNATTAIGATEPVAPPYYQETYSVLGPITTDGTVFSNGPTWVQDLSLSLGLGTLEPSLLGGTDFAYGGAETGSTPQNAGQTDLTAISLPSQLVTFEAQPGAVPASALFTMWIGSNDILDILNKPTLTAAQQATDVTDAVNNEMNAIGELVKDGAKHMLVVDLPDLGKTPEVMTGAANGGNTPSASLDALASGLAASYNTQLNADLYAFLQTHSLDLHILDTYAIIDNAVTNPSAYGLTNVTTPVWSGNFTSSSSGSLVATGQAAQDQYLFFDHVHPTETGHSVIAAAAAAVLQQPPACFAAGTRILTESGEVPVEALRVGDMVRRADGAGLAPVVWLGHRRVDCRRHYRPEDAHPVRVAAGAFGLGRPHRDLLLSPDHAVFVDGVLIPVRYLLNDATIRQESTAAVTYWHVELPAHGVLLAEGLPCESYLDTGNRAAFANGGAVTFAPPGFAHAAWSRGGCAPLVTTGKARDRVYRQVLAQAFMLGWRTADAGAGACLWQAPEAA